MGVKNRRTKWRLPLFPQRGGTRVALAAMFRVMLLRGRACDAHHSHGTDAPWRARDLQDFSARTILSRRRNSADPTSSSRFLPATVGVLEPGLDLVEMLPPLKRP